VLARTNHELMLPLAIALDLGLSVRTTAKLLLEEPALDGLLDGLDRSAHGAQPALLSVAELRDGADGLPPPAVDDVGADPGALATAMLGWAAAHPHDNTIGFAARIRDARARLIALRSDDAPLILATAHGTKGLEFDEVAVIGLDEGRFPSERSLAEADDPERALEEERRLAYVAWTRAKRALTLIYDPLRPSPFLLEAFTAEELNLPRTGRRAREPTGQRARQTAEPRSSERASGGPVATRGPP
jgi:superfamily I DNA/RNA helicase